MNRRIERKGQSRPKRLVAVLLTGIGDGAHDGPTTRF
jgi:hypothetical protein